jgi:hypothetical protein
MFIIRLIILKTDRHSSASFKDMYETNTLEIRQQHITEFLKQNRISDNEAKCIYVEKKK